VRDQLKLDPLLEGLAMEVGKLELDRNLYRSDSVLLSLFLNIGTIFLTFSLTFYTLNLFELVNMKQILRK
jgi:hypothetical protein